MKEKLPHMCKISIKKQSRKLSKISKQYHLMEIFKYDTTGSSLTFKIKIGVVKKIDNDNKR